MESPLLRAGVAAAHLALGMSPTSSTRSSDGSDVKSEVKEETKVKTEVKKEMSPAAAHVQSSLL